MSNGPNLQKGRLKYQDSLYMCLNVLVLLLCARVKKDRMGKLKKSILAFIASRADIIFPIYHTFHLKMNDAVFFAKI